MTNIKIDDQKFIVVSAMSGQIKELPNTPIKKIQIYNVSYENIDVEEAQISEVKNKNYYYISGLVEIHTTNGKVHHIIGEDIYIMRNLGLFYVSVFDNYEYITDELVYEEYKKVVRSFKKRYPGHDRRRMTNEYLRIYRKKISDEYKELFSFFKARNREFNQNTLENRRYMKLRKKLARNILKEILISRIIIDYRNKKILS